MIISHEHAKALHHIDKQLQAAGMKPLSPQELIQLAQRGQPGQQKPPGTFSPAGAGTPGMAPAPSPQIHPSMMMRPLTAPKGGQGELNGTPGALASGVAPETFGGSSKLNFQSGRIVVDHDGKGGITKITQTLIPEGQVKNG